MIIRPQFNKRRVSDRAREVYRSSMIVCDGTTIQRQKSYLSFNFLKLGC
ncbi:MAG: hypothetical protein HC847_21425 [Hydrococcus sp. RU_2_2]|jgi:hypothetical protein|nr:hypothetical protein [Hydrococcus sp. RU_2_2]